MVHQKNPVASTARTGLRLPCKLHSGQSGFFHKTLGAILSMKLQWNGRIYIYIYIYIFFFFWRMGMGFWGAGDSFDFLPQWTVYM